MPTTYGLNINTTHNNLVQVLYMKFCISIMNKYYTLGISRIIYVIKILVKALAIQIFIEKIVVEQA